MTATILLMVAAAILFYVMIGYPLLLWLVRRRAAPPIAKDPNYAPTVSILLAVYNGEKFIRGKIETFLGLDYPRDRMEIIIVSDGSTDRTDAIVEEFAPQGVRLFQADRGGKAQALNIAMKAATGEILFFNDVRQPMDKRALRHLAANFSDPTVGAVTGELYYINPASGEQADLDLYWRYESWARKRHSTIDSIFNTAGCFYAARRDLVDPIPADTLADDALIPLRVFFQGYRVILDPEAVVFDYPAVAELPRRTRTLAGVWQVYSRLPQLFSSKNRMRWHFLSHKLGRLLVPWAILLLIGATLAMPDSAFRNFLLADEAALFALAALDRFIPAWFPFRRLFSASRTFLLMNTAALLSIKVFFVSPQKMWKRTRVSASTPETLTPPGEQADAKPLLRRSQPENF